MPNKLFALALAVAAGISLARADEAKPDAPPAPANEATKKTTVDINDVRQFAAVFALVKQAYVEPVDDKTLLQSAVKGLLANLDPHSEYLDEKAMTELSEDTTGSYNGLGIEVLTVEGVLRVVAPIDDSPAERGGIKAGDTIVRIDGKPITSENASEASNLLRGKAGTQVTLGVVHEGASAPVDIKLTREPIRVASVRTRWIEPGYVYLRIAQFQEDTGGEVKRKLAKLRDKSQPVKGLVLDLRSNPGGLLTSAVEVSDDFLDSGLIVHERTAQAVRSRLQRDAWRPDRRCADRRACRQRYRFGCRDRRRRAQGQPPRPDHGATHLRQGLGTDRAAAR